MESAGVVDLIDKAWKIGGDVFESFVIHQIDGLDLKGLHKALGLGIVIGIATSAHRADETMFGQQVAIELGGVLRTTIRVVDAALWRLSYSDGRLQCRNSNAGTRGQDLMRTLDPSGPSLPPDGLWLQRLVLRLAARRVALLVH